METFTTSRGIIVKVKPVATLLDKLQIQHRARIEKLKKDLLPVAPMYEIKTATGVVEQYPHDETTLETDDERRQWADYQRQYHRADRILQAKAAEAEAALSDQQTRLIVLDGLSFDMPADEGWIARQRELGIEVPDDPQERRIHWFETEALADLNDLIQFAKVIGAASNVPEEALDQVEALFRRKVGRPKRDAAQATEEEKPERAGLVDEPAVRAGQNGNS